MNKENAKDYLPLIAAMADGKTIQYKHHNSCWADCYEATFHANFEYYRIKPETRTFDMWLSITGNMYPINNFNAHDHCERITVQEVSK
jgi:hypothetical protein